MTTRASDAITTRYMQTKAQAAGERMRWAIDAEYAGRTLVGDGRCDGQTIVGTRWQHQWTRG